MISESRILFIILCIVTGSLLITAFGIDGVAVSMGGFWRLQFHPSRLINDFMDIAGMGAALCNAAFVGCIGLIVVALSGVKHSGATFAAILTMMGFGLFGKTPLNIIPIIIGVFIGSRIVGKHLREYLLIALFGTALGPLMSALWVEIGLGLIPGLFAGFFGTIVAGIFLPPLAVSMLQFHQGYNLYNMGLTCGFLGLFISGIFKGFGSPLQPQLYWLDSSSLSMKPLIPALSLFFILCSVLLGFSKSWQGFKKILGLDGRLPSDFVDMANIGGAMLNSGLIGLLGFLYVFLVNAPLNGPVTGALFTIMGFAAFGTHLRNAFPVVLGVVAATLLTGNSLIDPGPILAALFATTLSPMAGAFGFIVGFLAGFVHLLMVLITGSWHSGLNLYNNGFAGGLTATFFIAVIQWFRSNRSEL